MFMADPVVSSVLRHYLKAVEETLSMLRGRRTGLRARAGWRK
jgi:hypothetical protein